MRHSTVRVWMPSLPQVSEHVPQGPEYHHVAEQAPRLHVLTVVGIARPACSQLDSTTLVAGLNRMSKHSSVRDLVPGPQGTEHSDHL